MKKISMNRMNKKHYLIFLFCLIYSTGICKVTLPRLISDGMILQRDQKIKIWGWADVKEKVIVNFNGKTYSSLTNNEGIWLVTLSPTKAGGPFTMEINASNQIVIQNILMGDVWVCSGQSNMELTMDRVKDKYPVVIAQSENTNIRQFLVPDKYDFKKQHDDLDDGSWISADPKSILSFSAVAYFFAKDIYEKYHVPIGLINASLGGSPVEAWMSEETLKTFPETYQELQRFKDDKLIQQIESGDQQRSNAWYQNLNSQDQGISKWNDPTYSDLEWSEMMFPGYWADGVVGNVNGSVWFRKKIIVPKLMIGKPAKLWLGRIVDADSVFVNGHFVGNTTYQYPPRKYTLNATILNEGENTIAIRVINNGGRGGFVLDKPYFLAVDQDTIDLKGNWKYKVGAEVKPLESQTFIRWKPAGLYNRMISPLLKYSLKGVLWYQGEANTKDPKKYGQLFTAMIKNWRENWIQGDFPFLFVQLPNFMETKSQPAESNWAEVREIQRQTLSLPNTAMAVTIDIGEWNDIHPLNKEDVGKRLSIAAQKVAYGNKKVIYSGPTYASHVVEGNKIIVTFSNTGSALGSKENSALKYFTIAGADKKFVWANAKIEGNKVIVWSDEITNPVVVRYAWADNPHGANLYNKEGLPASPFTTEK